jgi:hypothetical protein
LCYSRFLPWIYKHLFRIQVNSNNQQHELEKRGKKRIRVLIDKHSETRLLWRVAKRDNGMWSSAALAAQHLQANTRKQATEQSKRKYKKKHNNIEKKIKMSRPNLDVKDAKNLCQQTFLMILTSLRSNIKIIWQKNISFYEINENFLADP